MNESLFSFDFCFFSLILMLSPSLYFSYMRFLSPIHCRLLLFPITLPPSSLFLCLAICNSFGPLCQYCLLVSSVYRYISSSKHDQLLFSDHGDAGSCFHCLRKHSDLSEKLLVHTTMHEPWVESSFMLFCFILYLNMISVTSFGYLEC